MFTDFFYTLKRSQVPVSVTEWMTFIEALYHGYIKTVDDIYYLGRSILVKNEAHFDHFDVAFQQYFAGVAATAEIRDQVLDWLASPTDIEALRAGAASVDDIFGFDKLLEELEKRLTEQTEQHDGGHHWIGRGGTSPFGHSGRHPAGIRIGGQSRSRSAVQIAAERRFRNYRSDLTLDIRQMKMALRGLRQFTREGPEDELDLEQTIKTIAKNAGELEFVWKRRRKNTVKLLLLMDVGGSMDPFARLCSQLFSAAHSSTHFKDFQFYYFHNCIYDRLYRDMERSEAVSTEHLLHTLDSDYKVLLVGDATMSPYELTMRWGAIDYYERNDTPGIVWLQRLAAHFRRAAWLNPEDTRAWRHPTVRLTAKTFNMYPLTLDGLSQAVKSLIVKGSVTPPAVV
ncbi:VWA domain-containing protein [Chloroflexota bacterium]